MQAEVIWCNLTIVGRLTYCAHCCCGSINVCHFLHSRKLIKRGEAVKRSLDERLNEGNKNGGWERAIAWKWFSGSFYSRCLSVLVDETTKARSNTSPRKRKNMNSILIAVLSGLLKSEDSFYARCARRAKHTPNIDTNFTSSYIFTARRFSPLRSEFVFLLLLLEFLFVRFCFVVHSSITY